MSDEQEHPNPERWWRHRRWQAYISLAAIIGLGVATLFGYAPEAATPIIQSIVWSLAVVVLVYSGGASLVDAFSRVRK